MGRSIDRRADVFSIGVMLWEAAAGRRLWKDMDDINVVQALISGNLPTSPRPFNPDTPEAIERICVRALAPRASDRYETADDMRMELEQFLAESGALVNSRRTLGATVADLFSDKRDELRVIIEKQLTAMAQRSRGDSLPVHPAPIDSINSSTTSVHQASARSVEAVAINVGGSTSLMHLPPGAIFPPSTAEKPSRSTSPVPMIAAVGIALVSLTVLGAITFRKATPTSTVPVSGAGTQRPAVAVTSASAPDAVDIQLAVSTTPGTARVTLDGIAMTNPVDRRVPRDAREHVVRVEANGFEPFVENVRFERDAVLTVTLVRAASRPPPPPSPPVGVWKPGPRPASTHEQAATPAAVAPTSSPAMPATPSAKPRPKPDIDLGDMWH